MQKTTNGSSPQTNSSAATTAAMDHCITYDEYWFCDVFRHDEIALLRSSFRDKILQSSRVDNVGISAFTTLFDNYPEVFNVFVNKKVLPTKREDVIYSWETKAHSLRVLSAIEKCLNRLDNRPAFIEFVRGLSTRHAGYGTSPNFFTALIGCLRKAIFDELAGQMPTRGDQNHLDQAALEAAFMATPEYGVWNRFFVALTLALIHFLESSQSLSESFRRISMAPIQVNSPRGTCPVYSQKNAPDVPTTHHLTNHLSDKTA